MLSAFTNLKVIKKLISYSICSARNRFKHTATANNNIKACYINTLFLKETKDDIFSEICLVNN